MIVLDQSDNQGNEPIIIKMDDGGTLIVNNSPSKEACENFVRLVLEMKRKQDRLAFTKRGLSDEAFS
jgi:hypothetical protein